MFKNISPKEFQEKMQNDGNSVVLDVRTPEEYEEKHIPGSINIDIKEPDFQDKLDELPEDKQYLVYCRSGGRSARACQIMATEGFENLYNLEGGILDWNGEVEEGKG